MKRNILIFATAAAATGVILGALGAHSLEKLLLPDHADSLESFKTGVRYQLFHALALLVLGLNSEKIAPKALRLAGLLMQIGVVFFSGSIYLLATRSITDLSVGWLGPVTPIGGTLLISAWIILFWSFLSNKDTE